MAGAEHFVTKIEASMASLVKPVLDEVAVLRAKIVEFGHQAAADAALIGNLETTIAGWESRFEAMVAPLRAIVADAAPTAPNSMQDHGGIVESATHAA